MLPEQKSSPNLASDPTFGRDTFLLQETLLTLSEEYDVCDESGTPILYVQRPVHQLLGGLGFLATLIAFVVTFVAVMIVCGALLPRNTMDQFGMGVAFAVGAVVALLAAIMMRPKRHTTFYRDSSKKEVVLRIRQNRRFQPIVTRFTVLDAAGQPLAQLRKNQLANLIRKRWECFKPDGTLLCVALELSYGLALVRLAMEQAFNYVPTNFMILQGDTDVQIGEFNRKATILNHHVLDLKGDPNRTLDRRIALALGVMLDSGERG